MPGPSSPDGHSRTPPPFQVLLGAASTDLSWHPRTQALLLPLMETERFRDRARGTVRMDPGHRSHPRCTFVPANRIFLPYHQFAILCSLRGTDSDLGMPQFLFPQILVPSHCPVAPCPFLDLHYSSTTAIVFTGSQWYLELCWPICLLGFLNSASQGQPESIRNG